MQVLTSVFGMGTGVTLALLRTDLGCEWFDDEYGFFEDLVCLRRPRDLLSQTALEHNMVKPHDRLVLLGSLVAQFTPIAYQPGSLPGVFRTRRI